MRCRTPAAFPWCPPVLHQLETYWTDQESFDRWIEKELAYYADAKLQDKEVEVLSDLERIQRRNELDRQMLEKMKCSKY